MAVIGADFYTGNCHKWLCAPKGAAFLYARREQQHRVEPLVVGWGWGEPRAWTYGSDFLDYNQWLGTNDMAAYLSVAAAIEFQTAHQWDTVRDDCQTLVTQAIHRIGDLTGLPPAYPDDQGFYRQMAIAPLPPIPDLPAFKKRLYQEHRVEIPCVQWQDKQFIRVSIQGYNTQADVDRLLEVLRLML